MKFNFLCEISVLILSYNYVNSFKSKDCKSIVTSNYVTYIGCKEDVPTDSLTYRSSQFSPIYSFKV
jgi:hypothetical protein